MNRNSALCGDIIHKLNDVDVYIECLWRRVQSELGPNCCGQTPTEIEAMNKHDEIFNDFYRQISRFLGQLYDFEQNISAFIYDLDHIRQPQEKGEEKNDN